jgi:hypothetical protein
VAGELGVARVYCIVGEKSLKGNIDPIPGKGRLSLEYEDLRQLRMENKRLRIERDMLKK